MQLCAALPTLDVAEGALDAIFNVYKQLLPLLGGYLTYAGQLHHARLEVLLNKLGEQELETLEQRAAVCGLLLIAALQLKYSHPACTSGQDAEWFENKRTRGNGRREAPTPAKHSELHENDKIQVANRCAAYYMWKNKIFAASIWPSG